MESVAKVRECQWCHKEYYLSDGRYKYCSDECAEEAQRARCGENSCTDEEFCDPDDVYLANEWNRFCEKYRRLMNQNRLSAR